MHRELEELLLENAANVRKAEALCLGLSPAQLNWRPEPGRWSIAENLDHLNVIYRQDLDVINNTIAFARDRGVIGEGPFRYGFISRQVVKSQELPIKRKFKAPKLYTPSPDIDGAKSLEEYRHHNARLAESIHKA